MKTMLELFGAGTYIMIAAAIIVIMDIIGGYGILFKIMCIFDLDGYPNLIAKYKDPYRDQYREQRTWAYDNYKEYLKEARMNKDRDTFKVLKDTYKTKDYISLYNIMVDMDGDLDAIITKN